MKSTEDSTLSKLKGALRRDMPENIVPMLATLTDRPFSSKEWLFEPKLDGIRTISIMDKNGGLRLLSRRGNNVTTKYPEIIADLTQRSLEGNIMDGELVALDQNGVPSFQNLQTRIGLNREIDINQAIRSTPVYYYVFDLLYYDDYDLSQVALHHRKELLQKLFVQTPSIRLLDYYVGAGEIVYANAIKKGFEGIVAKHLESIYQPGTRSRYWLKIKKTLSEDFVIGGYTQGQQSRKKTFGALLLGYYRNGELVFTGHVGTGFNEKTLSRLAQRLHKLKTDNCPFTKIPATNTEATWVKPEIVVEVKFSGKTRDGMLRSPVFMRLRPDKPASQVDSPGMISYATAKEDSQGDGDTAVINILEQLDNRLDDIKVEFDKYAVRISNMNKILWPPYKDQRALTKRDLIRYLIRVSNYILPHLKNRPLSLSRFPDGIHGEHFFQKHWPEPVPDFIDTVNIRSKHEDEMQEYIMCDNLAALIWLGQLADIDINTWFSRLDPAPDIDKMAVDDQIEKLIDCPDFIIFDIDPYLYSGKEPAKGEPELSRKGFSVSVQVALWIKEKLDSLGTKSFVKTSGRTGLHIHVPIVRNINYNQARAAAETICNSVLREHRDIITVDWNVEKRRGKVFLDYNQNTRGKTLASIYSPRPTAAATVSMPVTWESLARSYPTDFTILTVPEFVQKNGDLWQNILSSKVDLTKIVQ